ncbi:flotillin family protein [Yoonia sediminilitoris]|uniref:Putative membrane protein YqiK n=1 Tax=Yoonia sediminilitoris TaxID=1286148 RepID=A0A2T6K6B3_9RHOB|nr:flotillin domain-containing protein [Yoonia sediminilitoris]PUB10166.1 putative membrane protein YqiK [Yoonia sediminilitoris]RCW89688.1 putative membrane protein YqiK [Yoonia sediminilitoris]
MSALAWIIIILVIAAIIIALAASFYQRATNEVALVRTGLGGRRVIIDGGTLAIPYFHEINRVNMQTLRMDVKRTGDSSLITKDRLRVDVGAEFYASVTPTDETVTRAAQTLGKRVFQPEQLKGLIDGMMIDALRSVAAQMTMDELHENRSSFVKQVREALTDTLANYGLQLDSVSLTALDQTPFASLDENNAFNAVGMRKLAEVIAKSKKERAEIEGDSQVSVARAAMESERRKLEINLEQRRAEIAQTQEVETLIAAQLSEIAARKAESERAAARSRIQMEQDIAAADIAKEQTLREAEIAQALALEIAEQNRAISFAAKSQEESKAHASADAARVEAVKAAEAVQTARQMAEAERRKALALIAAQEQAEAAAARAQITAASEKATAADKAAAKRAEADAIKAVRLAETEANLAQIKANNARSEAQVAMELEIARLQAMPQILAEMVKPAEKIDGISINHISGLGRGADGGSGPASPVNQTVDAILDMAISLPAVQKLGDAVGLNIDTALTPASKRKSTDD